MSSTSVLPKRSSGLLVANVGDTRVVYDLVTETVHRLNHSAGELLDRCDGTTTLAEAAGGRADSLVADEVLVAMEAALDSFRELGLVDRSERHVAPSLPAALPLPAAPPSKLLGASHSVIDYRIAFRADDEALLDRIDAFLGAVGAGSAVGPTHIFDVHCDDDLFVLTTGVPTEWNANGIEELLHRTTMAMNEFAVMTESVVTFHAGGVRSPEGKIVLLPAPSGSGKSTLTAQLVAAGWDYLSDEAIGVRVDSCVAVGYPKPLALSPLSVAALGLDARATEDVHPEELRSDVVRLDGDVGVVDRIVFPSYSAGAEAELVDLSSDEALIELLANTLNLAYSGEVGLRTLCQLVERVPMQRLVHGGDAVQALELA